MYTGHGPVRADRSASMEEQLMTAQFAPPRMRIDSPFFCREGIELNSRPRVLALGGERDSARSQLFDDPVHPGELVGRNRESATASQEFCLDFELSFGFDPIVQHEIG